MVDASLYPSVVWLLFGIDVCLPAHVVTPTGEGTAVRVGCRAGGQVLVRVSDRCVKEPKWVGDNTVT